MASATGGRRPRRGNGADPGLAAGAAEVRWAPRVARHAIRRLYQTDALGIVDAEQIDGVGFALYARCQSILRASAARAGRVTCPRCAGVVERRESERVRRQVLRCPACGWATTWGAYRATFHGQQLLGGSALEAFRAFAERFPVADTPQQRMLAIDRLLHTFHHQLKGPTRPAGVNLIEGSLAEVLEFLEALTAGMAGVAGATAPRAEAGYREAARGQLGRAQLGNRLRLLRRAAGLSGKALGARAGLSQSRVSNIETGRVTARVAEVARLAESLALGPETAAGLVDQARHQALSRPPSPATRR
jgi:predicted RNA-binding Zn-ribbon protein involved in translation (DUF1610 family)/DNA-binding XRE family transcriptional regulator